MNNEIIMQLIERLTVMLQEENHNNNQSPDNNEKDEKIELLTIQQCKELVKGLSEHTIRQLAAQNKIKYIRTGQGKRGKILINKASLLAYCGNTV